MALVKQICYYIKDGLNSGVQVDVVSIRAVEVPLLWKIVEMQVLNPSDAPQ